VQQLEDCTPSLDLLAAEVVARRAVALIAYSGAIGTRTGP
jgi:hypothetical protein